MTNEKKATLERINKLAESLEKKFDRDTYNMCFTLASDFNGEHGDEEICVCEIDEDYFTDYTNETGILYNGISVEDDIYRWEKI